jgi:predicted outer membrane repeat protein
MYGGCFRILNFDKIAIRNCSFHRNYAIRSGGAVYARNSDLLIDRCEFIDNSCGLKVYPWGYGGGVCSVSSDATVTHCYFTGNYASGVGGGASFEYADPEMHHNTFVGNTGGLAGGFGFLRSEAGRVVSNNLVVDNTAIYFGGGVAILRANTRLSNLTIVDNHSMYGGGIYCNDSAVPSFYNTILRGNHGFGAQGYIWDYPSAPGFSYCDVEGGYEAFEGSGGSTGYHGTWENNFDEDALFKGTDPYAFSILAGSPCRDAGTPDTAGLEVPSTDLAGNARIFNHRIDVGAYEYSPTAGISEKDEASFSLSAYPNPVRAELTIRIGVTKPGIYAITLVSADGKALMQFPSMELAAGTREIRWDGKCRGGNKPAPGTYFIRVVSENEALAFPVLLY